MSAIALRGVVKSFGATPVLRGVDLDVAEGEVVVLLGPSGCGKTTLLRLVAGLDTVDGGSIEVGRAVFSGAGVHVEPEKRRVGFEFQNGALFPHLDTTRNVGFGLERSQRRGGERVDEMLALVGMTDLAARMPDELSGGQQQRVALARALAPRPDVVLMDEPFSNLDAVLRLRLRHEVRDVIEAAGVTTVFVTHDREEAFTLADRVAVMRDGVIVQVDRPEAVYEQPRDRWVAEFVGDADFAAGTFDGASSVDTIFGRLGVASSRPIESGTVDVLVRPEHLVVGSDGGGGVAAEVVALEFSGVTSLITIRMADGATLRSRCLGAAAVEAGERVTISRRDVPAVIFVVSPDP